MTVEIGILIGVLGFAVTFAIFINNSHKDSKNYGERWGRLQKTLETMEKDMKAMKVSLDDTIAINKVSISEVHERIDNHLRNEHDMNIPRRRG
jgi:CRISPR/Cas system-associated endonuclease Cas3-HD